MCKLKQSLCVVLSSVLIFAGLSPVWGQRRPPKKIKKRANIEHSVERKSRFGKLRRTRRIPWRDIRRATNNGREVSSPSATHPNTHVAPQVVHFQTIGAQTGQETTGSSVPTQAELQAQVQARVEAEMGNQIRNAAPQVTHRPAQNNAAQQKAEQEAAEQAARREAYEYLVKTQEKLAEKELFDADRYIEWALKKAKEGHITGDDLAPFKNAHADVQAARERDVQAYMQQEAHTSLDMARSRLAAGYVKAARSFIGRALEYAKILGFTGKILAQFKETEADIQAAYQSIEQAAQGAKQETAEQAARRKAHKWLEKAAEGNLDSGHYLRLALDRAEEAGFTSEEMAQFQQEVAAVRQAIAPKVYVSLAKAREELAAGQLHDASKYIGHALKYAKAAGFTGADLATFQQEVAAVRKGLAYGWLEDARKELRNGRSAGLELEWAIGYAEEAGLTGADLATFQKEVVAVRKAIIRHSLTKAREKLDKENGFSAEKELEQALEQVEKAELTDAERTQFQQEVADVQRAIAYASLKEAQKELAGGWMYWAEGSLKRAIEYSEKAGLTGAERTQFQQEVAAVQRAISLKKAHEYLKEAQEALAKEYLQEVASNIEWALTYAEKAELTGADLAQFQQEVSAVRKAIAEREAARAAQRAKREAAKQTAQQEAAKAAQEATLVAQEAARQIAEQVEKERENARTDAYYYLQKAQDALAAGNLYWAEEALKRAIEYSEKAGLTGVEQIKFQQDVAVVQQAIPQREAYEYLAKAQKSFSIGKLEDAVYYINQALKGAEEIGFTVDELAPFKQTKAAVQAAKAKKDLESARTNTYYYLKEAQQEFAAGDLERAAAFLKEARHCAGAADLTAEELAKFQQDVAPMQQAIFRKEAHEYLKQAQEKLATGDLKKASQFVNYADYSAQKGHVTGEELAKLQQEIAAVRRAIAHKYLEKAQQGLSAGKTEQAANYIETALYYAEKGHITGEALTPFQQTEAAVQTKRRPDPVQLMVSRQFIRYITKLTATNSSVYELDLSTLDETQQALYNSVVDVSKQLEAWKRTHDGKAPVPNATDPQERALYNMVSKALSSAKKAGWENTTLVQNLREQSGITKTLTTQEWLLEYRRFRAQHPERNPSKANPDEKRLYQGITDRLGLQPAEISTDPVLQEMDHLWHTVPLVGDELTAIRAEIVAQEAAANDPVVQEAEEMLQARIEAEMANQIRNAAPQETHRPAQQPATSPVQGRVVAEQSPSNPLTAEAKSPAVSAPTNSLDQLYPTWRMEFATMFTPEQLDFIADLIAQTDEWIFVQQADGTLGIRNPAEWDYEARFFTLLERSGVKFTPAQIKQLMGGTGIRGFTSGDFFAIRTNQGFAFAHDAVARSSIWKNGEKIALKDLKECAAQGDAEAAAWARELEVGKRLNNLLNKLGSDSPVYQIGVELKERYGRLNTPSETVAELTKWAEEHGELPRKGIEKNGHQFTLEEQRAQAAQGDKEAAALAEELELGNKLSHALQSWDKNSPEYKAVMDLIEKYDKHQNIVDELTQWAEKNGTMPRHVIQINGSLFTLKELRAKAAQGDAQAAALAEELKLGHKLNHALQNWDKDFPEYKAVMDLVNKYGRRNGM